MAAQCLCAANKRVLAAASGALADGVRLARNHAAGR